MKTRTIAATAALALAGAALLTACGGSDSTTTSSDSAAATTAASSAAPSSSAVVGGDPSTWAPIEITQAMNNQRITLVVGQRAVFTDLPAVDKNNIIFVKAKKKGIVKVTQAGNSGGVATNAGLAALNVGKTRIRVWDGKPGTKGASVVMQIRVTVNPYVAQAAGASAGASMAASPAAS